MHFNFQVLWQYISANFEASPRAKYTELLGYTSTQVSTRLHPPASSTQDKEDGVSAEVLADKMASLGTTVSIFFVLVTFSFGSVAISLLVRVV